MISYLFPTRNRHRHVSATLDQLGQLSAEGHEAAGGAEVIIVDDASDAPVQAPSRLANGLPVRLIRRPSSAGAAARNDGVREARGEWIVMLDDDSWPLDEWHLQVLEEVEDDVAAVGARIVLPDGNHEAGGLPEVFIGCGAAVRRDAFLEAGGYDETFHYYVEEYDLCARLILRGWRIVHDWRFSILHCKTIERRDLNQILHRLVRNNAWLTQRYAPSAEHGAALEEVLDRYGRIAVRENAYDGFQLGRREALDTLADQSRSPLPLDLWHRFIGRTHVAQSLLRVEPPDGGVAIVCRGKNARVVEDVLDELQWPFTSFDDAAALVIGTLSPGPMMNAGEELRLEMRPVLRPWSPRSVAAEVSGSR